MTDDRVTTTTMARTSEAIRLHLSADLYRPCPANLAQGTTRSASIDAGVTLSGDSGIRFA